MSQHPPFITERYQILDQFKQRWDLDTVKKMTLHEYNSTGNTDSFCYWVEHITDKLGRIKGAPSNKFGIWQMKNNVPGPSLDFLDDGNYKWYKKYGDSAQTAFEEIKRILIEVVESSVNQKFELLDRLDYFALAKWKIAFLYSNNQLFPVYNKKALRIIARNFDFPNFRNARISAIHRFLVEQIPDEEDMFEFAFRQYHLTKEEPLHNYYLVGSKYRNDSGSYIDIAPNFYSRDVISVGFFWNDNLANLYGKPTNEITKWLDKNRSKSEANYSTARSAIRNFLSIKEGDIIAVKSHGMGGNLTIIAYAQVVSRNGDVYFHDPGNLGHCIHVDFLETGLSIKTGLTYAKTIHEIVPYSKKGHFEKIFKSYAVIEKEETEVDDFELSESRINEKQQESTRRSVSYSTTVSNVHNKIQSAFAHYLKSEYPNNNVQTEKNYIDVVMQSDTELFFYEVKPYSTAYSCVRAGIGQLLDYYHSNPSKSREIHLCIVGPAEVKQTDQKFIDLIKQNLSISFEYICFDPN